MIDRQTDRGSADRGPLLTVVAMPSADEHHADVDERNKHHHHHPPTRCDLCRRRGLVVGNYCHDVLFLDGTIIGEGLGGAASFVSNVLDSFFLSDDAPDPDTDPDHQHQLQCHYISKAGPDLRYAVPHPPLLSPSSSPTTLFHAHFSSSPASPSSSPSSVSKGPGYHCDRVLRRVSACDPILPSDLPPLPPPAAPFDFGLAVGVAGEIPPDTLARMIDLCHILFVDVQSLIRKFDPVDGTVSLAPLRESGFFHLLPRIGFLKASADEAPFIDIQEVRRWCCILVTHGKEGCMLYCKDGDLQLPAFPTQQVDPTGAGDSFLGGFVAGLLHGLTVPDAALLGNFFGSLTVRQIGVPKFHSRLLQVMKDELNRKASKGCFQRHDDAGKFQKSEEHEEFLAFLLVEAGNLTHPQGLCTTEGARPGTNGELFPAGEVLEGDNPQPGE